MKLRKCHFPNNKDLRARKRQTDPIFGSVAGESLTSHAPPEGFCHLVARAVTWTLTDSIAAIFFLKGGFSA
jgi:hypothetical protein